MRSRLCLVTFLSVKWTLATCICLSQTEWDAATGPPREEVIESVDDEDSPR